MIFLRLALKDYISLDPRSSCCEPRDPRLDPNELAGDPWISEEDPNPFTEDLLLRGSSRLPRLSNEFLKIR